jgi:hypothetical protein
MPLPIGPHGLEQYLGEEIEIHQQPLLGTGLLDSLQALQSGYLALSHGHYACVSDEDVDDDTPLYFIQNGDLLSLQVGSGFEGEHCYVVRGIPPPPAFVSADLDSDDDDLDDTNDFSDDD